RISLFILCRCQMNCTLVPYTTLFRSDGTPVLLSRNEYNELGQVIAKKLHSEEEYTYAQQVDYRYNIRGWLTRINDSDLNENGDQDRKSTRLNSSHVKISYAVFCLKKK